MWLVPIGAAALLLPVVELERAGPTGTPRRREPARASPEHRAEPQALPPAPAPPPAASAAAEAPSLAVGSPVEPGPLLEGPRGVSGVITARDGAPLRSGAVQARVGGQDAGSARVELDGRFQLDLPPGDAILTVTATGFVRREVGLGAERPQDLVVALEPARRVSVWVLARDTGRPMIPYRLEARGGAFHEERQVLDPAGYCVLEAPLEPLMIRVSADPQAGYVGWEGEDALAGRVVLERGVAISGQVVHDDLRPLTGIPRSAVWLIGARHAWAPQRVETEADGSFIASGIAHDEAWAALAFCQAVDRTSALRIEWQSPGTSRVAVPVWRAGRIVLDDGPPAGPVSLEAGALPPPLRPPPRVKEQEGSATWSFDRLPPGTWTVRWQGRVVGTVELEARGEERPEARLPWPGDPAAVRAAWEAWHERQAAARPTAPGSEAPVRSGDAPGARRAAAPASVAPLRSRARPAGR